MQHVTRVVVFAVLFLLSSVSLLPAQSGVISGRVADSAGAPLADATVMVVERSALRATTNDAGRYEIMNVPPGTYTVRVRRIGYASASQRVTLRAAAGVVSNVQQDFTLARTPYELAQLDVVVGSRARHTAADELAVPVDVFTATEIRQQGTTETSQVLQQLAPSVNFPRQSVTDADDIVRPFTMRGLSPDHTLVLLNGLRRHRTSLVHIFAYGMGAGSSGVDLNALPASAIERIEVLREGAAAQYGSDAIAGVVNVVLKRGAFAPFLTADLGQYVTEGYPNDGTTLTAGGGVGLQLGRGTLGLFGEYRDRDATNRAGADPEDQIVEGDADQTNPVTGELIQKNNPVPQPNHHWGDGLQKDGLGFANFAYPLDAAGTTELYAFGGYSYRRGEGNGFRRQGISERNWPEIYPIGYLPIFNGKARDASAAAGVRGEVSGWSFDVGGTYGHNSFRYDLDSTMNVSLGPCLTTACAPGLDGVLGTPDDPGIPNKTSIYAGTLRLNELGGNLDVSRPVEVGLPAVLNVALGVSVRRDNYEIEAGEPASYIQGGHLDRNGDPAPPGSQVFAGFQPSDATDVSRTNIGTYLDLESNLTPELLANIAGRYEHYSDFGDKVTGKLSARYQLAPQFVLRGTASTGFRAPNLAQNFFSSHITNFELDEATGRQVPVEVGIFPTSSTVAQALGARPLEPETSVNLSAGFAVTPVAALTLTADFYYIRIDDRIILTASLQGDSVASILANAGHPEVTQAQYFTNALKTRTLGTDVTATYRVPLTELSRLDLIGTFNFTRNKVLEINEPPELAGTGAVLFDSVVSGGLISLEKERPETRASLTAQYAAERLHGLVRGSYWGEFTSAQVGACGDCIQTYGAKTLFDVEVGYRIYDLLDLSIGARNIFDTYPDRPSVDNSFGFLVWPAASPFGYNGRYVYTRVDIRVAP